MPNHRSPYVFAHLSRMARFYDGWLSYSPNSLYRGRTYPIAFIQAYIEPYRQGLQDILIVSIISFSICSFGSSFVIFIVSPFIEKEVSFVAGVVILFQMPETDRKSVV